MGEGPTQCLVWKGRLVMEAFEGMGSVIADICQYILHRKPIFPQSSLSSNLKAPEFDCQGSNFRPNTIPSVPAACIKLKQLPSDPSTAWSGCRTVTLQSAFRARSPPASHISKGKSLAGCHSTQVRVSFWECTSDGNAARTAPRMCCDPGDGEEGQCLAELVAAERPWREPGG